MLLYCYKMTTLCSEMIKLALPFCRNEISNDIGYMYPNRSAIIMMGQALINIYKVQILENYILNLSFLIDLLRIIP